MGKASIPDNYIDIPSEEHPEVFWLRVTEQAISSILDYFDSPKVQTSSDSPVQSSIPKESWRAGPDLPPKWV